jgi:hypothetical protein
MVLRQFVYRLLPLALLLGALFGLQQLLKLPVPATVSNANACVPCECDNDQRINCLGHEFYAVYTLINEAGRCNIDVFLIQNGKGTGAFRVTTLERSRLPETVEEPLVVDSYYEVTMYQLPTGEFQVNAGPDSQGKMYSVTFTGCPAENITEETYIPGQG